MFEQPLYEYEPTPAQQQEGTLFNDYELKGWLSSSGLFKVIGLSAVANIVALVVFAQTSLLTMKGCDSPLVGSVCQVLDTVYVGALLFGTDREYVDAEYDKIDLGDSEITFIDVSKETPPLTYPAGYFQVANPEDFLTPSVDDLEFAAGDLFNGGISGGINTIPGITAPQYGGSLIDTPPNIPKPNSEVVDPDSLPQSSGNGTTYDWPKPWKPSKPRRGSKKPPLAQNTPDENSGFPQPDPNTVAENQTPSPSPTPTPPVVEPTDPVTVEVNKRPYIDLAVEINRLLDKNMVSLETPFKITATGKIGKNGKFEKGFKYTSEQFPDPNMGPRMIEVVKAAIEAMNESGHLQYLALLNGKDLSLEIFQDDQKVVAQIQSEFENDLRPKSVSSLINGMIVTAKKAKEDPNASQNDKDDLVLLQNARAEAQGKKVLISFMIPKGNLQAMIMKKLAEQKAQPKPTETTGGVPKTPDPAVR